MLGAALGGAMADYLGWRWEFGVQVPVVVLCLLVASFVIPNDLGLNGGEKKTLREAMRTFDFKGSILMSTSVTFLILGLVSFSNRDPGYLSLTSSEPRREHPSLVSSLCNCLAGHLRRLLPNLHFRRDTCRQTHHARSPHFQVTTHEPDFVQPHRCLPIQRHSF